jgi:hypothetical protein
MGKAIVNHGVYFYHIQKTGGRGLITSFIQSVGARGLKPDEDYHPRYLEICKKNKVNIKGKIFCGWNPGIINKSKFYFAFSHLDKKSISDNIFKRSFTVSIFRDPIKRLLSRYNQLCQREIEVQNGVKYPPGHVQQLEQIKDKDFFKFCYNLQRSHRLMQTWMFSDKEPYSVNNALDNISKLNHWFMQEDFDNGLKVLSKKIGIDLKNIHSGVSRYKPKVEFDEGKLKDLLSVEYELYNKLKTMTN